MTNNIQVSNDHYYSGYDNLERFIAYHYQIELLNKLNIRKSDSNILEVGVGNNTVSNYLRQNKYNIITCDYDVRLKPTVSANVIKLPFINNCFDVVLCFEVLEHIPWENINLVLSEINRVTHKYAIISIPYSSIVFNLVLSSPQNKRIFNNSYLKLFYLRIPYFFKKVKFDGEHYWEMGRSRHSKLRFKKFIKKYFRINNEFGPSLSPLYYYFVLEKI
jgi:ubiquinone/menaquinone biosynthesis C-methylase UbiE